MLSPETAVGPLQAAPPDRPTVNLEQALRNVIVLIFGDRVLDMNERELLRSFFKEVAMRAQNGGVGMGGTPPAEGQEELPQSPMEMNSNTEDYGTVEGAEPEYEEEVA